VRLFRITTERADRAAAVDGIGASLYPGRWNERGRRAVYSTTRIPLGVLEILVQANVTALVGFVAYPLDVPDAALTRFDRGRLRASWRTMVGRDECRAFGEEWASAKTSVGLIVPSAVVPEAYDFDDFNVILDPEHPEFHRVTAGDPIRLDMDSRLAALVRPMDSPAGPAPASRPKRKRRS
jgi:RES domain-containing protein